MKRRGILNAQLSAVLATLGHTDTIVVADSGLPIPEHVERVDLAVVQGVPAFADVLGALADELEIQHVTVAFEMERKNAAAWQTVEMLFADAPREAVDHEELKRRVADARAVVRTGEATPYANAILECGVPF